MVKKEEVFKIVLQSDSLPILPAIASKLVTITSKEETSMGDVANLISKDISLSAKILKVANSAFYNFPTKIGTINQAVSIMGMNAVRSLVLSFSFLKIDKSSDKTVFNYRKFWEKSLASAVSAKLIITNIDNIEPEEVFVAGLLQNIGELILARVLPKEYEQVLSEISNGEKSVVDAEQEILGVDHTEIGYEIAKKWGFPQVLLTLIRYHHFPEKYQGEDKRLKLTTKVIHLSGVLSNILYSDTPQEYYMQFKDKCGVMFGFNDKIVSKILENVHSEIAHIATFFNFKIKEPQSIEDILLEANMALSVINLNYEQMNKELVAAKVQLQKLTKSLEIKNKRLEELANIDGLTEVYNHRYFQNFLEQEISRSLRKKSTISLIIADIDNFKEFNDNHGHQVGDFILKEVSMLMRDNLREYDLVARYGGEEFALILPETDKQTAEIVAEKIRKIIEAYTFSFEHEEYHVTVSFGISDIKPATDSFKKNDLISFADKAMYESKKKGRNRVTIYEPKKKWFSRERR